MLIAIPRSARGVPQVTAKCDDCGAEQTITCDYERRPGNRWIPNEGQAHRKLAAHGWTRVRGRLRCPTCKLDRKTINPEETPMTTKPATIEGKSLAALAPLRQPTREQKREIIAMLDMAYDTAGARYRGTDTDKTIAETIGPNIMPGWVAEIREDLYGPAGENDEMRAIRAEIEATQKTLDSLRKRLDAVCAAVGPKAR
ncbi:hypothetical protein DWF04_006040 [Cereibacter sphaeroides f. sp. denitrificans]|nr:hypothetical protein DWF04_06160 [Cereibacter sphaeroides f. sp. denitrificans]